MYPAVEFVISDVCKLNNSFSLALSLRKHIQRVSVREHTETEHSDASSSEADS